MNSATANTAQIWQATAFTGQLPSGAKSPLASGYS
jgi:hypothetical protein